MKPYAVSALLAGGLLAIVFFFGVAFGPVIGTQAAALVEGESTQALTNSPKGGGRLAAAATYIGISEQQLRDEMSAGTGKTLTEVAIAHGKTRDGLIAALLKASEQELATFVDQKLPAGGPGKGPGGPGARSEGNPLAAAATYIGTTEADLRTKQASGQTLAQIATSAGKTKDGLIKALVDDATAKIDAAQKAGTITADQATKAKTGLTDRFTRLVDAPGFGGFGRGPGGRR
jgi:DNA-binding phage protein